MVRGKLGKNGVLEVSEENVLRSIVRLIVLKF